MRAPATKKKTLKQKQIFIQNVHHLHKYLFTEMFFFASKVKDMNKERLFKELTHQKQQLR